MTQPTSQSSKDLFAGKLGMIFLIIALAMMAIGFFSCNSFKHALTVVSKPENRGKMASWCYNQYPNTITGTNTKEKDSTATEVMPGIIQSVDCAGEINKLLQNHVPKMQLDSIISLLNNNQVNNVPCPPCPPSTNTTKWKDREIITTVEDTRKVVAIQYKLDSTNKRLVKMDSELKESQKQSHFWFIASMVTWLIILIAFVIKRSLLK